MLDVCCANGKSCHQLLLCMRNIIDTFFIFPLRRPLRAVNVCASILAVKEYYAVERQTLHEQQLLLVHFTENYLRGGGPLCSHCCPCRQWWQDACSGRNACTCNTHAWISRIKWMMNKRCRKRKDKSEEDADKLSAHFDYIGQSLLPTFFFNRFLTLHMHRLKCSQWTWPKCFYSSLCPPCWGQCSHFCRWSARSSTPTGHLAAKICVSTRHWNF